MTVAEVQRAARVADVASKLDDLAAWARVNYGIAWPAIRQSWLQVFASRAAQTGETVQGAAVALANEAQGLARVCILAAAFDPDGRKEGED